MKRGFMWGCLALSVITGAPAGPICLCQEQDPRDTDAPISVKGDAITLGSIGFISVGLAYIFVVGRLQPDTQPGVAGFIGFIVLCAVAFGAYHLFKRKKNR